MLNELFARFDRLAHVSLSATPRPYAGHTHSHSHTHHVDDGLAWRKLCAHLSAVPAVSLLPTSTTFRPQKRMIINYQFFICGKPRQCFSYWFHHLE